MLALLASPRGVVFSPAPTERTLALSSFVYVVRQQELDLLPFVRPFGLFPFFDCLEETVAALPVSTDDVAAFRSPPQIEPTA